MGFRTHVLLCSYNTYSGPQPIWSKVVFSALKKKSPLRKRKNIEIFVDFNQNSLIYFQKHTNFNNDYCSNHACKSHEPNNYKKRIARTWKSIHTMVWRLSHGDFNCLSFECGLRYTGFFLLEDLINSNVCSNVVIINCF